MNSLILRTIAPLLVVVMVVYSLYVMLRGHNDPGGGFIGGLIAASAMAIYGIAAGPAAVRRALKVDPLAIAGFGVVLAGLSGMLSLAYGLPFLTGLWAEFHLSQADIAIATPMTFDIGVYFVVLGTIAGIALGLEEDES